MASSSLAEQHQLPPKEQQHQQFPCAVTQQSPQPNDLNQQQAKAPNGPSYEAYHASYDQQQQQYDDYSRAYPHHQLEASQIHSEGHSGCREGGGDGIGHDGGINPNKAMLPTPLPGLKTWCEICSVECNSLEMLAQHKNGKKHSGCRERGGDGREHDGGINPNKAMPPTSLPVLKIWCEICRAECNSLEILAQHKNGKKHRKTVQRYEEMQKQKKVIAEYQTNFMPGNVHTIGCQQADAIRDTKQTIECQQANVMPSMHASGYQQENAMPISTKHLNSAIDNAPSMAEQEQVLPTSKSITKAEVSSSQLEPPKASETACNNVQVDDANKSHNEELEQKGRISTTEGTSELPNCVEPEGKVAAMERTTELPNSVEQNGKVATTDGTVELSNIGNYSKLDAKQGGMKRTISNNSRGGKRLKKSKPEPLRICTICKATCESLTSFDAHTAGKKHLSKLRKFQQHGAVFGPIAVYIPPNQPIFIPTNRPDPLYFGLSTYQMVGQVMNSFDDAHLGNLQNQDAPLVFTQKEKTELENNVNNVANCAAQESDLKEIDDKLVDDGIGVRKTNDDALMSESKDVSVETGDVTELLDLDYELKEKNISEVRDTLKVAEDSASKKRNSNEADDICKVEETALGSGFKENSILEVDDTASVKEDVV